MTAPTDVIERPKFNSSSSYIKTRIKENPPNNSQFLILIHPPLFFYLQTFSFNNVSEFKMGKLSMASVRSLCVSKCFQVKQSL